MGLTLESFPAALGVITALISAVVYIYFRNSYKYWKKLNVPYIEPIFPMGNFTDSLLVRKHFGEISAELYRKLEDHKYGGTYMFTKPGFLFRDPELIKNILVKDFPHFHDRGFYHNEEREPLTRHLFLLPGTKWRNLRAKLTPTFTSSKMKMMFQTLVDCGTELGNHLDKVLQTEQVIEIKEVLARYTTDVISSCAFGIQCNCFKNPDAEFREWGKKIFEPTLKNMANAILTSMNPKLMETFKLTLIDANVSKYFIKMVEDTVSYRERNDFKRDDFMQLLIEIKNKGMDQEEKQNGHGDLETITDQGLSMETLAAQAFIFFIAGFETSSATMAFCLYELAVNLDVQEKVRQEILSVLDKYDGKLTYDSIQEMKYLDKVVAETLRKYPPIPVLNRECTKEYKIPGTNVVLNKGMLTIVPVLGLHYDPKYYPNPEKFDPERFSEEEKVKRNNYVYLPFGEGPRICIGMRFGLMQTKVGLLFLLSKFQFSPSDKTPIPMVLDPKSFALSPQGGMWFKIKSTSK